jgi:hypothetical protein
MRCAVHAVCAIVAVSLLSACGRSAITPRTSTAPSAPELNATRVLPTTNAVELPTAETPSPSPVVPIQATLSPAALPAASPTLAVTRVRPTPTSSGPLTVAVYIAGCRRAPTTGKPGNVIIQIALEASGGNGRYQYFNEGVESPSKFIDIEWEKGTRLIGTVKVLSGDGQVVQKRYDIPIGEIQCK